MDSDLKASLMADRTMNRLDKEPTMQAAYEKLPRDVHEAYSELSAAQRATYAVSLAEFQKVRGGDLAVGYALNNLNLIDTGGNGAIDQKEIKARKELLLVGAVGDSLVSETGLPKAVELVFLDELSDDFQSLRREHKDGAWWNLNQGEAGDVTKADLETFAGRFDKLGSDVTDLLTDVEADARFAGAPAGVVETLKAAGVEIKQVNGRIEDVIPAAAVEENQIIKMSQAIYNPSSKEVICEEGLKAEKPRQHEIGHAIDDALVPGLGFFTSSREFNSAVDADLKKLPQVEDWNTVIPNLHLFVRAGLNSGKLIESSRKELFADLYQNGNKQLADDLRHYFPETAGVVDAELKGKGIERFPNP
jgi:hypothetical protein